MDLQTNGGKPVTSDMPIPQQTSGRIPNRQPTSTVANPTPSRPQDPFPLAARSRPDRPTGCVDALISEQTHGRLVAPRVPLPVPEPVAFNESGEGYGASWTAHLWIPGIGARTYTGAGVWIHADLMPGNLITRGGRLAGVIDLGAACIGHRPRTSCPIGT